MADSERQGKPGNAGSDEAAGHGPGGEDLERRGRALDEALAVRRPEDAQRREDPGGGSAGYGQALKLSSEFIAGVVVGAGLGWFIDRMAGTSPWGLIVFLLIGFAAGVLNVLRSAGMVAEPRSGVGRAPSGPPRAGPPRE